MIEVAAGRALGAIAHLGDLVSSQADYGLAFLALEIIVLSGHQSIEALWFGLHLITTLPAFVYSELCHFLSNRPQSYTFFQYLRIKS